MKKFLRLYITKYNFAMQDELHDPIMLNILKNIPEIRMTNLYAIVQTNSMCIDIDSISICSSYDVECNVIINKKLKTIKFNLLSYYYEELENKEDISFDKFVENLENGLLNIEPFKSNNYKREDLYKDIEIVRDNSFNSQISLRCPFYWFFSKLQNDLVILNLYRVINHFNIDILNELEIIYIGKSMNSTIDRLKEHNKWSAIIAKDKKNKSADFDYLVYVFNFDQVETLIKDVTNNDKIVLNYEAEYNVDNLVTNLEIAFISHYKPLLNIEYVDTIFEETDFVKKELINHGYTDLIIEMIINEGSLMGNIKTSKAKSEIVNINLTL